MRTMNEIEKFKEGRKEHQAKDSSEIFKYKKYHMHPANPMPKILDTGPVGPKYYKPKKSQAQQINSDIIDKQDLNKRWIKYYEEPMPDVPGSVDWETYVPEDKIEQADEFYPIRLIKRNKNPEKNDTTYHSSYNDYRNFDRNLLRHPEYRNSEAYQDKQQENKRLFELFRGIWEKQQPSK